MCLFGINLLMHKKKQKPCEHCTLQQCLDFKYTLNIHAHVCVYAHVFHDGIFMSSTKEAQKNTFLKFSTFKY